MKMLTKEQIILLHRELIKETGGTDGIRDEGLLESALSAPFQSFDGIASFPSIQQKAARLGFGLIKNHAFIDGNKRIGVHAISALISSLIASASAFASFARDSHFCNFLILFSISFVDIVFYSFYCLLCRCVSLHCLYCNTVNSVCQLVMLYKVNSVYLCNFTLLTVRNMCYNIINVIKEVLYGYTKIKKRSK